MVSLESTVAIYSTLPRCAFKRAEAFSKAAPHRRTAVRTISCNVLELAVNLRFSKNGIIFIRKNMLNIDSLILYFFLYNLYTSLRFRLTSLSSITIFHVSFCLILLLDLVSVCLVSHRALAAGGHLVVT